MENIELFTTLLAILTFLVATVFTHTIMGVPTTMCLIFTIKTKFRTWFDFFATRTLFMSITFVMDTMGFHMLRLIGDKLKIVDHVVARISIYVMNYFIMFKFSIEMVFHNTAMFKRSFAVNAKNAISIRSSMSPFISRMIGTADSKIRTMTRTESLFSTGRFKFLIAAFTEMFHNITSGIDVLKGYAFMPVSEGDNKSWLQ